ncbi:TetR family transcriptional regulator [Actinoplanes sp. TBRC 11911]|uniref:TetR family transcriptional regulator n=1 Tax=Actinoplanes sp. TBRC 11911 TaxID=2729386 RepID=UPI00145EAC16|nr:TetR family transcriptional regulator [Actinoplanes sp. TBRC 11911]NMO57864.1 TetR family transcriptional regulator [Actinoplanes sp. TBRC 11911]
MRAAGEATRERILRAAVEELLAYGAAGARVNRIAQSAHASKERLYAYFPNKEALYAAAVTKVVSTVTSDADLTADDLPGYAGRLFDVFLVHPEYARINDWLDEQHGNIPDADEHRARVLQPKVDEIRRGQQMGLIDPTWHPVDLINVIIQITRGMAVPGRMIEELGRRNDRTSTPETRRRVLIETIARLIAYDATA